MDDSLYGFRSAPVDSQLDMQSSFLVSSRLNLIEMTAIMAQKDVKRLCDIKPFVMTPIFRQESAGQGLSKSNLTGKERCTQ
jgi:hypothetical protein